MHADGKIARRQSAHVVLWLLAWLAMIDIAVNLAFGPNVNRGRAPDLQRYFEYGRSVEGKLVRKVAGDPKTKGNILSAGWLEPDLLARLPDRAQDGADLLVTAYGQSFTMNASFEAAAIDSHITVRPVGGPGAPPSHTYAAYKADAPFRKAPVVVFGILSSSVGQMGSMSGLIWLFESPAPFTFPRYRLDGGRLTEELPLIRTEAEFRDAFGRRSTAWRDFKAQLKQSDLGYDSFTFEETLADSSSIVRLIRRGWVAHRQAYDAGVYTPGVGFNPDAEQVGTLKALLVDLAQQTRARNERLIVLLLHTRGHADHLHTALGGLLTQESIDYVSTHALFSADDPQNFLRDGHYVAAANTKLSRALLQKIRSAGGLQHSRPPPVNAAALQPGR